MILTIVQKHVTEKGKFYVFLSFDISLFATGSLNHVCVNVMFIQNATFSNGMRYFIHHIQT